MKVLVCGGRDFDRTDVLCDALDRAHALRRVLIVIHGDARGADRLGRAWAERRGVLHAAVPAPWNTYGGAAGPIRNAGMLLLGPDLVVAFPGGAGTAHMMGEARRAGVPVWQPMVSGSDAQAVGHALKDLGLIG